MDAHFIHQFLGIEQHIKQVRNRRALITANIGNARLQQSLGNGQNTLAVKDLAVAEPQRFHFLAE